eukprot:6475213-Amphidinium_carterae.2
MKAHLSGVAERKRMTVPSLQRGRNNGESVDDEVGWKGLIDDDADVKRIGTCWASPQPVRKPNEANDQNAHSFRGYGELKGVHTRCPLLLKPSGESPNESSPRGTITLNETLS